MSGLKHREGGGPPAGQGDIDAFLARLNDIPPPARTGAAAGRLVLAMDATLSRQHSWDEALAIQGDMFAEAGRIGGLGVQLVYFRGHGECRASRWTTDTAALARLMSAIRCEGGSTQLVRVLKHLRAEAAAGKVNACVYIGDALEEDRDAVARAAGEVGLLGTPVFMFQEGRDPRAEAGFRDVARLTNGAYFRFAGDAGSILRELLRAVAVYAAGGRQALADHSERNGGAAALLLRQMK